MKIVGSLLLGLLIVSSLSAQQIQSPNHKLNLEFRLTETGEPSYQLSYETIKVIPWSRLGLELRNQASLLNGFELLKTDTSTTNDSWEPVWGEEKRIANNYREAAFTISHKATGRTILIRFKLFNDGLGFRYELPSQEGLTYATVSEERTEFNVTGDHKTFWIPGDYDTNEYPYTTSKLSQVDATTANGITEISTRTPIGKNFVQTPLMMKTSDGLYINIHEAALLNYPAMHLRINQQTLGLTSQLVPDATGNKAYIQTPFTTPWRTIVVATKGADVLTSRLILNLNEPSKIKDTDWIKPQKFLGIWWGMHVGTNTWNYADQSNIILKNTDWSKLKPNGKHGATTSETKRYIDFAAAHGFAGVLVEGWNVGWEDWFGNWKEEVFDFVTPYPDFDVKELQRYGEQKGVKLIMHHETSASVTNYERRLESAIRFMKENGYDAVKTGYVGRIIPRGEFHDGQWMVNHYARVAEKLGQNKIMLDAHEPVRPTGLHRTYPNWLACEAARGNEFNAWSVGNPPEHETILPFTRLMGGPMDYTPGVFQIKMEYYKNGRTTQVHTTLAKQLALYVTLYSPLQMAADLPENYAEKMDAFQFIKDVPVDWDATKVLDAEPGDYIVTARKGKNQEGWFVGAITDENSRNMDVKLDFLDAGKTYTLTLYADAPTAHWKDNPMAYEIKKALVNKKTLLKLKLAPGGGTAASLQPSTTEELKKLKAYK